MISPKSLRSQINVKKNDFIEKSRNTIKNILIWKDKRKLVVVWPCSIHNVSQALNYALELKKMQENYNNLFIVMRVYFEKPRTVWGWKWLISDPNLNNDCDIEKGLFLARKLLVDINNIWIPTATEFLSPIVSNYYYDLVSYGAIWARNVEYQILREFVSSLDMPLWFKNDTYGNADSAINSILSAWGKHSFLNINEDGKIEKIDWNWNPYTNLILRWWKSWPNYYKESILNINKNLKENNIKTWIVVDLSHANSWKIAEKQIQVLQNMKSYISNISWIMVESNLKSGSEKFNPLEDNVNNLQYWVSITDSCIDIFDTKELLYSFNKML